MALVADSANGSGLRLWLLNDRYEDFLNKDGVYYCAYVNEYIFRTTYKDSVDERYLLLFAYDEANADLNDDISGEVVGRFPANAWSGVRVLD